MSASTDHNLLLSVERQLERLVDRFDEREEDGDEVTNVIIEQLRKDVVDLFDRAVALEQKVTKLQRIVTELLSD